MPGSELVIGSPLRELEGSPFSQWVTDVEADVCVALVTVEAFMDLRV